MLDRALADRAAALAARSLDLGPPLRHAVSAAVTYLTPSAFLRVVPDGHDSPGTIVVARYVAANLGGAAPLGDPLELVIDDTALWVEPYERLHPVTTDLGSWYTVGERLAALHALTPPPTLRPARRLAASRTRLALGPTDLSVELEPHFDQAAITQAATPGPLVLTHCDAHRSNLLYTDTGPVWVDFEYAGLAPAALDLAFSLGDTMRFAHPRHTADFLAGYASGGGQPDLAAVVALTRVRDICAVADYAPFTQLSPDEYALRRSTYLEPFRNTAWHGAPAANQLLPE